MNPSCELNKYPRFPVGVGISCVMDPDVVWVIGAKGSSELRTSLMARSLHRTGAYTMLIIIAKS
jgi:hypothetical protein